MDQRQLARSALANLKSSFKKARVRAKGAGASPIEDIKAALEEADSVLSQADDEPAIEIELEAEKPDEGPKETILESYNMAPKKAVPASQPPRGRGRPRKVK